MSAVLHSVSQCGFTLELWDPSCSSWFSLFFSSISLTPGTRCGWKMLRIVTTNAGLQVTTEWLLLITLQHCRFSVFLCWIDTFVFICRPAVFHCAPLCAGHHCCGAFLHLLHYPWWLHRAQGLHQPQSDILCHHLRCQHPTQDPGTFKTMPTLPEKCITYLFNLDIFWEVFKSHCRRSLRPGAFIALLINDNWRSCWVKTKCISDALSPTFRGLVIKTGFLFSGL